MLSLAARRAVPVVSATVRTATLATRLLSSAPAVTIPVVTRVPSQMQRRSFASAAPTVSADGLIEFKLADIGEGIAECELLKWYVQPGQPIKQFDKVCEVQSDKANVEITSRYDGVVTQLHCEVGKMAKVGSCLITIKVDGDAAKSSAAAPAAKAAAAPVAAAASAASSSADTAAHASLSKVLTTPAVRRLAIENKVNLTLVRGTGPEGRILKEDMLKYVAGDASAKLSTPVAAAAPAAAAAAPAKAAAPTVAPIVALAADKVVPIAGLQRIMVQTMNAANAVPHFGFCEEIVVDELVQLRKAMKPMAERRGIKLSYMPFIIKATSLALRDFPGLNAHTNADCTEVVHRASHNIGIAMDTPRGLLVPNVKNCQSKSILEIATELLQLQALGKEGKLGREHLTGGTFTLSNIGSIGGTYASPILVLPEVAIAALGRFQTLPRFDAKGQVVPVTVMNMSYSGDHRVVDGATMASYSNAFKRYIENPAAMLAELR